MITKLSETDIRYRINLLMHKGKIEHIPDSWICLAVSVYISSSAILGDISKEQSDILLKEALGVLRNRQELI